MKRSLAVRFAVAAGVVLAGGSLALSAASASSSRDRATISSVRAGTALIYSTLDPGNTQGCNALYCNMIYDHLMRFNARGKLIPNLAQSVSHPSAATYVYHLRHGVKFWNGDEMTAADVANSINYQRYPKFQSSSSFVSVKSVKPQGRYTVVITL